MLGNQENQPTIIRDRDLKFYLWLLTYNQYPQETIRKYERGEKIKYFDDYGTLDSRALQSQKESIKKVPIAKKEKQDFTHWSMPMFSFYDNKTYSGKVKTKEIMEPQTMPKVDEELLPGYFYENKNKVDTQSPKEIKPVVVMKKKEKLIVKENIISDKIENKEIQKEEVVEDNTPIIIIPTTLNSDSPSKAKEKFFEKKVESTDKLLEEPKNTLNPNLMKSYNDKTEKIEKANLTNMDDLDHKDVFASIQRINNKKDPIDCKCAMCEKNKSRFIKIRKFQIKTNNGEDLETQQINKLESRIKKFPKLNKSKIIIDPYASIDKTRSNRHTPSQPNIKTDFSASYTKFLKQNIESKEIKSTRINSRREKFFENLEGTLTPNSKTSLGTSEIMEYTSVISEEEKNS